MDLNKKDRAKRYHKSSIFNRQYSILPACPVCYFTRISLTSIFASTRADHTILLLIP